MTTEEKYRVIDESMNNSYELLVNDFSWEVLPIREEYWILEDLDDPETIDKLIDYFISTEEYEKCARLVKIKEEL
jgi:hypothetical protein